MPRHSQLFALTAALAASVCLPAQAEMMFNRVASFAVTGNLPVDADKKAVTSSTMPARLAARKHSSVSASMPLIMTLRIIFSAAAAPTS